MVLHTWTQISISNWQFLIPCYHLNLKGNAKHILFQQSISSNPCSCSSLGSTSARRPLAPRRLRTTPSSSIRWRRSLLREACDATLTCWVEEEASVICTKRNQHKHNTKQKIKNHTGCFHILFSGLQQSCKENVIRIAVVQKKKKRYN